jgi:hypothetical protein
MTYQELLDQLKKKRVTFDPNCPPLIFDELSNDEDCDVREEAESHRIYYIVEKINK